MMDFDATSLYLTAMWDESPVYLEKESGYVCKPHTKDVIVEILNYQTSQKDGKDSAILRIKYYKPPDLRFQHLPIKEKVENIEFNRMRKG